MSKKSVRASTKATAVDTHTSNNAVLVNECLADATRYIQMIEEPQLHRAYAKRARESQEAAAESAKAEAEMLAIREREQEREQYRTIEESLEEKEKKQPKRVSQVSKRLSALRLIAAKGSVRPKGS